MGCFNSKIVAQSRSFKEELRYSLQRRINGFPMLEDLIISKNGGDHLRALVSTANTVAKKLHRRSQPSETVTHTDKCPGHITNHETINAWELMADLEEEEEGKEEEGQEEPVEVKEEGATDPSPRSKSFHVITEELKLGDGPDQLARSRSFHTVEEYEALVAGKPWPQVTSVEDIDCKQHDFTKRSVEEIHCKLGSHLLNDDAGEDAKDGNYCEMEKSLRRKTRGKELSSLIIPSTTIDLRLSGSLRAWEEFGGQEGEYVTPKFGNFHHRVHHNTKADKDMAVFDPELLAAVEEAMEEMKAEEEMVLRQIADIL